MIRCFAFRHCFNLYEVLDISTYITYLVSFKMSNVIITQVPKSLVSAVCNKLFNWKSRDRNGILYKRDFGLLAGKLG